MEAIKNLAINLPFKKALMLLSCFMGMLSTHLSDFLKCCFQLERRKAASS